MCLGGGVTPNRYHPARRTCIGSPPSGRTSAARGLKPHANQRTAANRIDVASRLSVRTTAACRLFPSGEALPSTTSAGSCLPLFGRFLATTASSDFSSAYMLGGRLFAFPSRPGTSLGTGETSQVPRKELLHVHKVSDRARFFPCKPLRHGRCCLLIWRRCATPNGWSTANAHSGDPRKYCAISPATPTASPSPTAAWSRSTTTASPSSGRITASMVRSDTGDDARYPRVHPPLPDACLAARLPSYPLLRPADQPNPRQEHRAYPPCSQCHSSRSTPSRLPTQRLRQALSPKSRKRPSIPAPPAAAACASSRHSCGGNSPSTIPPRFRERSGSTPHDDDLTAATPEKPFACLVAPSRPRPSSLQRCVHHATAAPIFTDIPARRSEKRLAPDLQRHPHRSADLAADPSCGPHTAPN